MLVFIAVAAAVVAGFYQAWSALLVRRFTALGPPMLEHWPSVTVMKPLCGAEPQLLENLSSFCVQDYPDFNLVFGVHSADDPAVSVVERLKQLHPAADIHLVVGEGRPVSGNPKVANLAAMLPAADNQILVIADSDMKVGPNYLKAVAATLSQPEIGVATCLYVSHPSGGLFSRLGSMGVNHGFLPSVLVGQAVGRVDGCFGATMALTRAMFDEIGGFAPLKDQLADDYMIGALVRRKGKKIALVPLLPTTVANEPEAKTLIAHEVRWGRTLASIDRMGYAGTLVTQAIPLGLLALLADGGETLGLAAWALAWTARLVAVRIEEQALGLVRQPALMVVARDFLTLGVQIAALSGRTVRWRGGRYRVTRQGILVSLD